MERASRSEAGTSGEDQQPVFLLAPPRPGAGEAETETETASTVVETAIVLEVSVALLADPPTQFTVIDVANDEGVVTLRGQVASSHMRHVAEEIASSHPDVASAINNLEIAVPPDA